MKSRVRAARREGAPLRPICYRPDGRLLGYRYSAFGITLEDTASLDQPLRWKGRWHSTLDGIELYDIRARQWCPELGTFLSVDDYRYHGWKGSLWSWPGNSPTRWADPTGNYAVGVGVAISVGVVVLAAHLFWDYDNPFDGPRDPGPAPEPGKGPAAPEPGAPGPAPGGPTSPPTSPPLWPPPPGPDFPQCRNMGALTRTCCKNECTKRLKERCGNGPRDLPFSRALGDCIVRCFSENN